MKTYMVYYMKPEFFREGIMGYHWLETKGIAPTNQTMRKTHVFVRSLAADGLDAAFYEMQGENWSLNGEARELIKSLGLQHTSMSVGDIISEFKTGNVYIVDTFGFRKLERRPVEKKDGRA